MNKVIVTCEHSSDKIPKKYNYLFESNNAKNALKTHAGLDLGARDAALFFSRYFNCPYVLADYSRLLIELNRSLNHKNLFSQYCSQLSPNDKTNIIDNIYQPYRTSVIKIIKDNIRKKNRVVHLSIHSFTPILNTQIRNTDIGLLYDPKRSLEKKLCSSIKEFYINNNNKYRLRLNYPYKGYTDGFTTYLRKLFNAENYLGIEVEINQKFVKNNKLPKEILQNLCEIIKLSIDNLY